MPIDFFAGLPAEQRLLESPGTFGNSRATIRHRVSGNADYVRIIPDAPDVSQLIPPTGRPVFRELRDVAWSTDAALMADVDGPADDHFFIDVDNGVANELIRSRTRSSTMPPNSGARSGRRCQHTAKRRPKSRHGPGAPATMG